MALIYGKCVEQKKDGDFLNLRVNWGGIVKPAIIYFFLAKSN